MRQVITIYKYDRSVILTVANYGLLAFLLFSIFFVMLFPPQFGKLLYQIGMTGVLLAAFLCIEIKYRRIIRWLIAATIMATWAHFSMEGFVLNLISKSLIIGLYIIIVAILVKQAASSKTVNRIVILESVNGYLMIGLFYSIIIGLVVVTDPTAYKFQSIVVRESDEIVTNFNEYIYYSFNAFTTVTYGDALPRSPLAKSLSMAIGFTGQMYVVLIIAMLVGKYSGESRKG
jgi:hypothetical protein